VWFSGHGGGGVHIDAVRPMRGSWVFRPGRQAEWTTPSAIAPLSAWTFQTTRVSVVKASKTWELDATSCRTLDAKERFDTDNRLHVSVDVDCSLPDGPDIRGALMSDSCDLQRP
jgi:hypothetical protein